MDEHVTYDESEQPKSAVQDALSKRKRLISGIVTLAIIVAITLVVFLYRDDIAQYAAFGYPSIFIVCFLLNCGVFGLSPSGLVAVEMSFIYNPIFTAIIAGLGAGLGEVTSFYAGMQTDVFAEPKFLKRFSNYGQIKTGILTFIASFVSGNLSDAVGIAGYLIGASAAKVLKMLLLVIAAHTTSEYFGFLG